MLVKSQHSCSAVLLAGAVTFTKKALWHKTDTQCSMSLNMLDCLLILQTKHHQGKMGSLTMATSSINQEIILKHTGGFDIENSLKNSDGIVIPAGCSAHPKCHHMPGS